MISPNGAVAGGFDSAQWTTLCASGELITRGPLNDTYRVELAGVAYFVRRRVTYDMNYGQTFAGERHVPLAVRQALRVPALLDVVCDATGRETFAIFEFIDPSPAPGQVEPMELPEILATIHATSSGGLGDLGGPLEKGHATNYLRGLVDAELRRLGDSSAGRHVREAGHRVLSAMGCFDREPPCLCHGDVHAQNFLRRSDGQISVIDWEAVRFRVAAADFNQMHHEWLSQPADEAVQRAYADLTARDPMAFARQIATLRFLWHVRTFNFHVLVRGEAPAQHAEQLEAACGQERLISMG